MQALAHVEEIFMAWGRFYQLSNRLEEYLGRSPIEQLPRVQTAATIWPVGPGATEIRY